MTIIAGVILNGQQMVGDALTEQLVAASMGQAVDSPKVWRSGPAVLVRVGNAATPEAAIDIQPDQGRASGLTICFDGRLDNRAELLEALGRDGDCLKHAPDSEIVLTLHERFGDDVPDRLVGDYAYALWHTVERRLFCVRSPIGWRPFLWTFDGARFGFASTPRALLLGLGLERQLNEGLIGEVISTRIVNRTETFWKNVHQLEQGCSLTLEKGEVRVRRWHNEAYEDLSHWSERDHVDRFNELFDQALIAVNRSSTPVAAHLSGGLDSSAIVCRATELHRQGRIGRNVEAISVRYPGEPHDETEWSSAVEQHLGIEARVVGDMPYDLNAARNWCRDTFQLPVRPNTMGPTQSVCTSMRARGERVLLTGEGGDDWLNGSHAHWPDLLLQGRLATLLREGFAPDTNRTLRSFASQAIGPIFSARRRRGLSYPTMRLDLPVPHWIRPEWARRIELESRWKAAPHPDFPRFAQRHRYSMMGAPYRHVIFDPIQATAGSYGVELRHPFHDIRLVRFLMGARGDLLRRNGVRKHLLREAMRGTMPERVRTRQSKAHFSAPIIDALIGFYAQREVADVVAVREGWVDGAVIRTSIEQLKQWRIDGLHGDPPNNALAAMWFVVAIDLWLESAFAA